MTDRPILPPLPTNPLVSVIMPSFNQGAFVAAAIDSILEQDYRPLEVIVVDGASKDETVSVLKNYDSVPEVRWWSEPDEGPVDAVNKGFGYAKGDILGIQSSDDGYLPGAITNSVDRFVDRADLGLVYGDIQKIDGDGVIIEASSNILHCDLAGMLMKKMWIPQPSAFFRSDAVKEIGKWNPNLPYTPDVDLWIRIWMSFEVEKLDGPCAVLRVHGEQRDTQHAKIRRDWNRMIHSSPDIKRLPLETRRAAYAGCHVNALEYSGGIEWRTSYHALMAALWYPENGRQWLTHWRRFVPGFFPIRNTMARIARAATGKHARR